MMALKFRGITKSFQQNQVLKHVNLEIPSGSIFFLMGINGAGKTTLLKIATGLIASDRGEVKCRFPKSEIAAVFEGTNLIDNLSAYENLKYYSLVMGNNSTTGIEGKIAWVGLDITNKKPIKTYSIGMKKRLLIACALLKNSQLLILDEPFNGLDPVAIAEMKRLIGALSKAGMTIILSSHLIKETEDVATHYGILHQGELLRCFYKKEGHILDEGGRQIQRDIYQEFLDTVDYIPVEVPS
ncbi:MAG: ATP-binding cassette domain-containing protein [Turicibacter sp.]|nr:ATP-binding cassette domain-containing protein [Turicibacter sp.]